MIQVNPTRDLDIIANELVQKDLQYLEGAVKKLEALVVRANDKTKKVRGRRQIEEVVVYCRSSTIV